ncbi:MAG: SIS domain-containing protein [Chloroflexota bacterium]
MTSTSDVPVAGLDRLTSWRESSSSGEAIAAALSAARGSDAKRAVALLDGAEGVAVTGAGSSYYLAQAAAAVARRSTRRSYVAAPLSELLLRPDGIIAAGDPAGRPIVVVSRSGSTSEAVDVVERSRARGHPTVAVTCRAESPLAQAADITLISPSGDETAIVMTRSFASMLALLVRVIATVGRDEALAGDLDRVPLRWGEAVAAATVGARLGETDWTRVVILGGGPKRAIADEWGLKLTETSQVPTMAYEPLEFRHGPISVCEPGVLVVGLLGDEGTDHESRVMDEAGALGATTWVLTETPEAGGHAGAVSAVGTGLAAAAALPLLAHPAHALAFTLALTRDRDPDAPRHLDQVVIIDPS